MLFRSVNEAYCLLSSYIREEGKVGAKYNTEHLQELVVFLADILKHPENFVNDRNTQKNNSESNKL